jgi:uncharacterized protein YecE (DUF72 family)
MPGRIFIGTAGWSIPRASAHRLTDAGTHLQRYAQVFSCSEINTSFHRPHAATTYARWSAATPPSFRFAVKVPRAITHEAKLRKARPALEAFLQQTSGLGHKRGALLVQLPPSLVFDRRVAARFLDLLRALYDGTVVCEPRHATWFTAAADAVLVHHRVARVAADPPPVAGAGVAGAWPGTVYLRMHGSPRKYWSRYSTAAIRGLAAALRQASSVGDAWCVFDNTASGAALENAFELHRLLSDADESGPSPEYLPARGSGGQGARDK